MLKALKSPVHYLLLWWAVAGGPWLEHSVGSYPVLTENLRNLRKCQLSTLFFPFLLFLKELCIPASPCKSSSGVWHLQARNSFHLTNRLCYRGRWANSLEPLIRSSGSHGEGSNVGAQPTWASGWASTETKTCWSRLYTIRSIDSSFTQDIAVQCRSKGPLCPIPSALLCLISFSFEGRSGAVLACNRLWWGLLAHTFTGGSYAMTHMQHFPQLFSYRHRQHPSYSSWVLGQHRWYWLLLSFHLSAFTANLEKKLLNSFLPTE